jgi:hypothetical protein
VTVAESRIAVKPSSSTTPEQARDLRARAWRYVFDCYQAKKKAGVTSTGDEAKGLENEIRPAPSILPR